MEFRLFDTHGQSYSYTWLGSLLQLGLQLIGMVLQFLLVVQEIAAVTLLESLIHSC